MSDVNTRTCLSDSEEGAADTREWDLKSSLAPEEHYEAACAQLSSVASLPMIRITSIKIISREDLP